MKILTQKTFCSFSKIGFIGLGNMGFPMAANLSKKGHEVYAYDIDPKRQADVLKSGFHFRNTIKSITNQTNIFITMLPNSTHSIQTCQSDKGIFPNASKESIIIDCSTISPLVAIDLSEQAKKKNLTYVDAPVSGGVTGAAAGTLTFMLGAQNDKIVQQCQPILECMGKSVINCGKIGAGQIAKMCNNMALAIQMIGVSQALALGVKMGMDQKILSDIMSVSTARCWSVDTYNPVPGVLENVPASRDYERGFGSQLMLKDLGIAYETARKINAKTELGDKSKEIYEDLVKQGLGTKDFGIIYQELMKGNE